LWPASGIRNPQWNARPGARKQQFRMSPFLLICFSVVSVSSVVQNLFLYLPPRSRRARRQATAERRANPPAAAPSSSSALLTRNHGKLSPDHGARTPQVLAQRCLWAGVKKAFIALPVPAESRARTIHADPAVSPPSDRCPWLRPKARLRKSVQSADKTVARPPPCLLLTYHLSLITFVLFPALAPAIILSGRSPGSTCKR
jgi:hypothetical protein